MFHARYPSDLCGVVFVQADFGAFQHAVAGPCPTKTRSSKQRVLDQHWIKRQGV
jgi:hypothetical protein